MLRDFTKDWKKLTLFENEKVLGSAYYFYVMIKSTILLLSPILSFLLSISGQNFWRQINPLGVGHRRPFIITNHWSYGLDDAG